MEAFRNNDIKVKWASLSEAEKMGLVEHSAARAARYSSELAHVIGLAAQEGLIAVDFGSIGEELPPEGPPAYE